MKKKAKERNQTLQAFLDVINKIMPYALACFAAVVILGLSNIIPFDRTVGRGLAHIANALRGVFSNFGAIVFAILLLYHAFFWRYDIKRKICLRRVFCSVVTVIFVGIFQHLVEYDRYGFATDASTLYELATVNEFHASHGGGVLGGVIGNVMHEHMWTWVAYLIVFIVLLFMILQLFNITPYSMLNAVAERNKAEKEAEKERKKQEKAYKKARKRKNISIYDDADDTREVAFARNTRDKEPECLNISEYIEKTRNEQREMLDVDDKIIEDDEDIVTEQVSNQFRPYDEEKDGLSQAPDNECGGELYVTTSQVKEAEEEDWEPMEESSSFEMSKDTEALCNETTTVYINPSDLMTSSSKSSFKLNDVSEAEELYDPMIVDDEEEKAPVIVDSSYKKEVVIERESDFVVEEDEPSYEEEAYTSYEKNEDEQSDGELIFEPAVEEEEAVEKAEYEAEEIKESYDEENTPEEISTEDEDEKTYEEIIKELKKTKIEQGNSKNSVIIEEREGEDDTIIKYDDYVSSSKLAKNNGESVKEEKKEEKKEFVPKPKKNYVFPPLSYLQAPQNDTMSDEARDELQNNARIIVETLNNFNVKTEISTITRGPTVTRYELTPAPGVRVRSIANLVDDIAMNLAAEGIRIECPIPGKSAVGIEVPNKVTSMVYLRELLEDAKFKTAKGPMTCALGKSISGENIYVDIEKTPHLLIAGATGMGKSVCINSLLVSLLYKTTPDDVRLILIDPKRVELSNYNGIPHLLVPVVCEPKKSLGALQWAVTEMESRFETIEQAGVRNLHEFNEKVDNGYPADKMARVLIVIDELADLKMAVPDIEGHITRLTQKARAAGIHIIIGTQRPSVDVITGLIKSNIPSRIAFRVPSQVDSRTILDEVGAEKLVSRGDMLVKIVGALRPARVQGSFVKASEIQYVIDFWKENSPAEYDEEVMHQIDNNAAKLAKNEKGNDDFEEGSDGGAGGDDLDPEFYNALELACEMGKISSSFLQRKLRLGFQRAARLIDQMEECGYIGEANGSKPRDVLITKEDFRELMMRRNDE
ncbi:MAG: DNA translocase FtsK [Clostridia bacterium]|nr:DNA translocase FtsK [Clostridia bacterium]